MSIRVWSGLRSVVVCVLVGLIAGCGGGGEPPAPPDNSLPLMVDGFGRLVPEVDFGRGDPFAAGAEGIAFDAGPIANAQVTLIDNGGSTRTATTDASGYYRIDIKNLQLPFLVKVKRADGSEWFSAGVNPATTRSFLPININGLTDKVIGYVADAQHLGAGAASSVTPARLSPPQTMLDPAKARVRAGLAVPLAAAGLGVADYDPMTLPVQSASSDRHASFLRTLDISRNAQGRTVVLATLGGTATFAQPEAVAADAEGALYIADTGNNAIRKIARTGEVTTLAGGFNAPSGVAVDGSGNVYVADSGNHVIRKITPTGTVTTLAGSGTAGYADGTATAARFSAPRHIAADAAGNIYISDVGNVSIRKVTLAGVVSTIAGLGRPPDSLLERDAPFFRVGVLAVDRSGALTFDATCERRPMVLDLQCLITIPPGGVAGPARRGTRMEWSRGGMALDGAGNLYYAFLYFGKYGQEHQRKIFVLAPDGTETEFASLPQLEINAIAGMTLDAQGNLVFVDRVRSTVRLLMP